MEGVRWEGRVEGWKGWLDCSPPLFSPHFSLLPISPSLRLSLFQGLYNTHTHTHTHTYTHSLSLSLLRGGEASKGFQSFVPLLRQFDHGSLGTQESSHGHTGDLHMDGSEEKGKEGKDGKGWEGLEGGEGDTG